MEVLAYLRRMDPHRLVVGMLICSALAFGQKAEYDFYREFRNAFVPKLRAENPLVTKEEILQRYAARLKSEGVADSEVARQVRLIQNERDLLESDYWNRFYTNSQSNFSKAPNNFLVQTVEGLPTGAAL